MTDYKVYDNKACIAEDSTCVIYSYNRSELTNINKPAAHCNLPYAPRQMMCMYMPIFQCYR